MIALLVITSIISCKKEETKPGQASFKVSITDAPGDYEHIYLEVLEVAINNGGWQTITQTQADTFDIWIIPMATNYCWPKVTLMRVQQPKYAWF